MLLSGRTRHVFFMLYRPNGLSSAPNAVALSCQDHLSRLQGHRNCGRPIETRTAGRTVQRPESFGAEVAAGEAGEDRR